MTFRGEWVLTKPRRLQLCVFAVFFAFAADQRIFIRHADRLFPSR
jgi:hypothetical protein